MRHAKFTPAPRTRKVNVLIVDDDAQVVRMLRLVLDSHGYHCSVAYGGAQALAQFAHAQDIDVIVSDLNMMWGDGISFIQAVRQHSDIPVFVITGRVRDFAPRMGALENVVVIPKPIDTDDLVRRIRTACRHRRAGTPRINC